MYTYNFNKYADSRYFTSIELFLLFLLCRLYINSTASTKQEGPSSNFNYFIATLIACSVSVHFKCTVHFKRGVFF